MDIEFIANHFANKYAERIQIIVGINIASEIFFFNICILKLKLLIILFINYG